MEVSSKFNGSMHSKARLAWVPRVTRPYESAASFIAKLAFLSTAPNNGFLLRTCQEIGAKDVKGPIFDSSHFKAAKFMELTGEQLRRVHLLSMKNLQFPSKILNIDGINSPVFDRLTICEKCFSEGYHSYLHQLSWLDRCFVHGNPLLHVRRFKAKDTELELAGVIHNEWFRVDGLWADSREPLQWGPVDRTPYLGLVPELARLLRATADWARGAAVQLPAWQEREASDAARIKLLIRASLQGQSVRSHRLWTHLGLGDTGFCKVPVSRRAANVLASMLPEQLEAFAMNRFEQSLAQTPVPAWLRDLRQFIKNATSGHHACFALLSESIVRWRAIWPARHDAGRSESVLQQFLGCGVETCVAIRLVEALSVFRAKPWFKAGRSRVPWFELTSLAAAIGPWLTRASQSGTVVEHHDDSGVLAVIDLINTVWVCQTLLEAMETRGGGTSAETVDRVRLARAGSGQAWCRREFYRPLVQESASKFIFITEDGRCYAMFHHPLAGKDQIPADENHRKAVFEAVCMGEAANQRQWPLGRFVRCSVPSAQMTARVNSILHRWNESPSL